MKVLVVDDDFDYASLVAAFLETEGHQTTVLEHSPEALDVYLEERPDLVLLDVIMPDQNGVDVAEEILDFDPNARITLVTALGDYPDDTPSALRSKLHLLSKPLRLDRSLFSHIYPASYIDKPTN